MLCHFIYSSMAVPVRRAGDVDGDAEQAIGDELGDFAVRRRHTPAKAGKLICGRIKSRGMSKPVTYFYCSWFGAAR